MERWLDSLFIRVRTKIKYRVRSVILTYSPSEEEKTLINRRKGFLKGTGGGGEAAKRVERNGGGRRMIEITMARQHARAGTHNGRARGTVKAVSTVNRGRGDPVVKGGRPWRRHSDRERERDRFALHPRFQGMIFMFAYSSMSTVNYLVVESCKKKTITIPICHVPSRSYVRSLSRVWEGGDARGNSWRKFRATGSRVAVSGGLVVVRWA